MSAMPCRHRRPRTTGRPSCRSARSSNCCTTQPRTSCRASSVMRRFLRRTRCTITCSRAGSKVCDACRQSRNSPRLITSTSLGSVQRTAADWGWPSMALSSPKWSPGRSWSTTRARPWWLRRTTCACPCSSTNSPASRLPCSSTMAWRFSRRTTAPAASWRSNAGSRSRSSGTLASVSTATWGRSGRSARRRPVCASACSGSRPGGMSLRRSGVIW